MKRRPDVQATTPHPTQQNALWISAAAATLIVLTVWLWSPAVQFRFVYDDHAQIEANSHIQSWSYFGHLVREPLWAQRGPGNQSPYYRPAFATLLLAQYSLFGASPAPWHAVSIGLHVLVSLALLGFLLLQRFDVLPAFLGTCFFAVSPVNAEVVSWLSGADNLLYTLLTLLALCLLTLAARAASRNTRLAFRCGMTLLLTLALFSKETAIVAIALCLGYEFLVLSKQVRIRGVVEWLLYLAPVAFYAMARALMIQQPLSHARVWTSGQVLATIPAVTLLELHNLLWPFPTSPFYNIWISQAHSSLSTVLAIAMICAICAGAWPVVWRWPFCGWVLAVVVVPLLPSLAGIYYFKEYDLFHDRYLYLSCAGLAMLAAYVLGQLAVRRGIGKLAFAAFLIPLSIYAARARTSSRPYQNDLSLFAKAITVAPDNVSALHLMADATLKSGNCDRALGYYNRAEQLRPDLWEPNFFGGIADIRCGHAADASSALATAAHAPEATTEQAALAWYEYGRVLFAEKDFSGAEAALHQAAARDPGSWKVRTVLAQVMEAETTRK